jgi:zinc protease
MIRKHRPSLFLAASAAVLVLCAPLASAQTAAQTTTRAPAATAPAWGPGPIVTPFPRNVWPQTFSDVAPDPAIRFGTLPNGMRYAIQKNATPTGQASLRLRFDAGSLMERDDQQGLAHFLEHMAFNGSKAVPEGDMIKILERLGLAFGADTNASTGWTETIYQLDLPRTDDETVDTALKLFREAASELLIAEDAIDRERGVVLSEERSRDTPSYRTFKSEISFLLGDSLAARRTPIGTVEVLRGAKRDAIADFYRDYYRPERATLVAVGDFDPAVMEEKIKARFADWKPEGAAGAEPALTLPLKREPAVKIAVEPGVALTSSISWVSPPDLDPDSKAERREDLTELLGFAVLNRRLERLARSAEPPFISAGAYRSGLFRSADITSLEVKSPPGRWREGLTAAMLEQRRAVQYGVTDAEIDREIAELRASYQAAVASAATRRTPALADQIAGSLDESDVVTSPAQEQEFFESLVPTFTAEAVSAALREAFGGSGPLVFLATPEPIEGGEAAVSRTLAAALNQPVEAAAARETKTWPYTDFGTPTAVVKQEVVEDLGATLLTFANGVRLTVKPTKFRDDQILVSVQAGSGRYGLPSDRVTPVWALSSFIEGGLADLTAEEIEDIMRSRIVGYGLSLGEESFELSGATRPEDLDVQMQLLAAFVTNPGWRPEPFQRIKSAGATIHDQQDATPSGVFSREMPALIHSGDKRWGFPSRDEIANGDLAQLRAIVDKSLKEGPIEIVMVGDLTVEQARDAVARTFGALPARPAAGWVQPPAPKIAFPQGTPQPVILRHKGRDDQALGVIAWKGLDYFTDPHMARTMGVLGDVMELRLIDELREKQGATYSPGILMNAALAYPGYGYIGALIETPPEKLPGFFEAVEAIAADLRDKPITQDELDRAKKPRIEGLLQQRQTNSYWLGVLSQIQADPRRRTPPSTVVEDVRSVTAADVQAAARKYLRPGEGWRLEVLKEGVPVPGAAS